MRDRKNHIVSGGKAMNFFINATLANVSVGPTKERTWLSFGVRTVRVVRFLSSRPGSGLNVGVLTNKVIDILVITISANILVGSLDKGSAISLSFLNKHLGLFFCSSPEAILLIKVGRVGSVGDGFKEFNFIDWAIRRSLNTEAFLTSTFFSSRFCLLLFIRVLGITEDSTLWLSLSIESRSCTSRKLGGFTSCQQ
jgi:hypothetical protein